MQSLTTHKNNLRKQREHWLIYWIVFSFFTLQDYYTEWLTKLFSPFLLLKVVIDLIMKLPTEIIHLPVYDFFENFPLLSFSKSDKRDKFSGISQISISYVILLYLDVIFDASSITTDRSGRIVLLQRRGSHTFRC